ncbi:hypothetical protein [Janthinobacterium sp. PAMC25594]|uniref:hypothetical protein n=1 Tax=Janthinobacterium sp. PAMC25594 TaxID=2861284 RepID=UPI001C62A47A|nr:hypothetical protein [Janthinobacterium sp. PAMC25594]QYG09821.1 hypothetical protein KY494_14415 [Janthinobacterium sp. PAMC25594]
MKASRVESARDRLIEGYVIQGVDERMDLGEMASLLNGSIRTGTGYLFNDASVAALLDQFGFAEYVAYQAEKNIDNKTKIIKLVHISTQGEPIHADF